MEKARLLKSKLPDAPGVYFFLGRRKKILYIGKATNLRERVQSYFAKDLASMRGPQIVKMVEEAVSVEYRKTDSALEALVLEASLIKTYKPRFNTDGKDDKSWNYLLITKGETYPRLLTVRGKDLFGDQSAFKKKYGTSQPKQGDLKMVFGPFVEGGLFKIALKIIRKIFPFYDTPTPLDIYMRTHAAKVRFNRTLGIYPSESTTVKEYARAIAHLSLFFEGKKPTLVARLKKEMHDAARKQEFERAQKIKRELLALTHIEDISLMRKDFDTGGREGDGEAGHTAFRIEAYDIAHLGGTDMVGAMAVFENGEAQSAEYRKFIVRGFSASNDTGALREILTRRLHHDEWPLPKLIVLDGGRAQMNVAKKTLAEFGYQIPLVAVLKDEHHRPKTILGDPAMRTRFEETILRVNNEAHRFAISFHRKKLLARRGLVVY